MMFRMMPGALGEEPVRLIYPELLKRLDDSNDAVRMAVCGTIAAFFRVSRKHTRRSVTARVNSCLSRVFFLRFFAGVWRPSAGRSLAPVARRESYACPAVSQAIYFARLVILLSVCVRARVYGLWCCLLFVFLWSDKKKQATAPQNVRGSVLTYSSEQLLVHLDDQDERMQRAVFAVLEVRVFIVFGVKFHVGHEQLGHPLTKSGVLNTVLQLF